jgi:hypothetical protein
MSGKLENMKLTNFIAIPSEKKGSEYNVLSEIAEMTEETQKDYANTSLLYIQNLKRWKFKEERCKEMKRVSFNHSTGVARCANCALFSELAHCISKVVNGFGASFKPETFK